jgi:hypothetical protein
MKTSYTILIEVLIAHQRQDIQYCLCGWGELGKSHPEHVAGIYFSRLRELAPQGSDRVRRPD